MSLPTSKDDLAAAERAVAMPTFSGLNDAALGGAGLFVLAGLALLLLSRAWSGALRQPLPLSALLASVCVFSLAAAFVRERLFRAAHQCPRGQCLALAAAPTVTTVATWQALIAPETSLFAILASGLAVVVVEAASWRRILRLATCSTAARRHEAPAGRSELVVARSALPAAPRETALMAASGASPTVHELEPADEEEGELLQSLRRVRLADGAEQVQGQLRVEVAPGERSGWCHVAFCPPLPAIPEVSVEQVEGPPARWRVEQALPHGARLEWKLPKAAAAEATEALLIELWATAAPAPQQSP